MASVLTTTEAKGSTKILAKKKFVNLWLWFSQTRGKKAYLWLWSICNQGIKVPL